MTSENLRHPLLLDLSARGGWLFKFRNGQLIVQDETFTKTMFDQVKKVQPHYHMAIVSVLGERSSGKSEILDALIRRLARQDVSIYAKSVHPSADGSESEDLDIATKTIILPDSRTGGPAILFLDVRSWTASSPYYLRLMKLAHRFSTVQLISHYRSLSPALSQLVSQGSQHGTLHIYPDKDVTWDGKSIQMDPSFFRRFCTLIKEAQHNLSCDCLLERVKQVHQSDIHNVRSAESQGHSSAQCLPGPSVASSAGLEQRKVGFAHLKERSPGLPVKATAATQSKEQASVAIYLGRKSILFTVCVKDNERVKTFAKKFGPCVSFSLQGAQFGQDDGDFNVYDILTDPTVQRDPKSLQPGQLAPLITQETAVVLYMKEAKKVLDDLCLRDVSYACVAVPHLISGAAKTAIKQSLLMAGFSKVELVPLTIAMAINLLGKRPSLAGEIISIHHSTTLFEISCIAVDRGGLKVKETFWTEELTPECVDSYLIMVGVRWARPQAVVLQEEEVGRSPRISHRTKSFGFTCSPATVDSLEHSETTRSLAIYAEQRRRNVAGISIQQSRPFLINTTGNVSSMWPTQDDTNWVVHLDGQANGQFIIEDGTQLHPVELGPRWSYHFQITPPDVFGYVCGIKFQMDGSLEVESLGHVNARVESKTSKFLSKCGRDELDVEVKQCLAAFCRSAEMSDGRASKQDESVRGRLARFIRSRKTRP